MNVGAGNAYRSVAVVGAGVIGVSWTALFLGHGLRVTVNDPRPDVEDVVRAGLDEIAPTMRELGLPIADVAARTEALRFEPRLAAAVAGTDAVQENGPELLGVKQGLWAAIEEAAPPHALLLSSSSGIPATAMAEHMREPERLLIGHPFNPPHLVPLVEIVPGEHTDPAVVERASRFYRGLGKRPQVLAKEIPGFVANRLQAALFREAIYLVTEGVVTEQELDDIVTGSIGMRWAAAGPFRTFHLGGGPGGLPAFFRHLGGALEEWWGRLGTPHLDGPTVALLNEQAQNFGGSVAELAAERDAAQIAVMRVLGELPGPAREEGKERFR
ncbi:UNVERIFIED_ORG: ketoreductase RED1 [Microbispora rosea subsp. rosea]